MQRLRNFAREERGLEIDVERTVSYITEIPKYVRDFDSRIAVLDNSETMRKVGDFFARKTKILVMTGLTYAALC